MRKRLEFLILFYDFFRVRFFILFLGVVEFLIDINVHRAFIVQAFGLVENFLSPFEFALD